MPCNCPLRNTSGTTREKLLYTSDEINVKIKPEVKFLIYKMNIQDGD